jgi:outer membrane protein assembly factor BamB
MAGRSNGAPIVVGDRVFTCGEPTALLCVSAADGKILWSDTVTYFDYTPEDDPEAAAIIAKVNAGKTEKEKEAIKESLKKDILRCEYFEKPPVMGEHFGFILEYTLPTPTSDGKQVYVVYGTGMAGCYELDGKRKWVRGLDKPEGSYSSNPLLAGSRLVVNMGGSVQGLDTATGKTVWKATQKECHRTPARAQVGGTEVVVMPSGDVYRALDGRKLASNACVEGGEYQSPVVHGDTVYSCDARGWNRDRVKVAAIRLKAANGGGITTEKLWEVDVDGNGYSSPMYLNALLYNSAGEQIGCKFRGLYVLDTATGREVYRRSINGFGNNYPCVAAAGPYICLPNQRGQVWVIKAGREYQEVAVNSLCGQGDQMVGAPLFVGTRTYIRTHKFLWCIGTK